MPPLTLYIGSDNNVTITGLAPENTTSWINNATVTFTLKDGSGNTITGPTPMSYVAASNGNYQGTLPYSVTLKKDTIYEVDVAITSTQGNRTIHRQAVAEYDEG